MLLIKFNSASVLHIPIEHADDVNKLYLKFLWAQQSFQDVSQVHP